MKKVVVTAILNQHVAKKKKTFPGFSARWLAAKLSVSQAYVSQILNGKRMLTVELLDVLCEALDIDPETKEVLSIEILRNQGWKKPPAKSLRETDTAFSAHAEDWSSAPIQDLSILRDRRNFLILESTQLSDYDGTAKILSQRLGLEESFVHSQMQLLESKGYLVQRNGRLVKSNSLLEFQSQMSKKDLVATHEQAMETAKTLMKMETEPEDFERRLITSCVFTCSRDQIPLLRAKIAEFLKETVADSATKEPEEVYQLGIQFFPATKK